MISRDGRLGVSDMFSIQVSLQACPLCFVRRRRCQIVESTTTNARNEAFSANMHDQMSILASIEHIQR